MSVTPGGDLLVYTIYACQGPRPYLVQAWAITDGSAEQHGPGMMARTLDEARDLIPLTSDTCWPRGAEDAENIVESWL